MGGMEGPGGNQEHLMLSAISLENFKKRGQETESVFIVHLNTA